MGTIDDDLETMHAFVRRARDADWSPEVVEGLRALLTSTNRLTQRQVLHALSFLPLAFRQLVLGSGYTEAD